MKIKHILAQLITTVVLLSVMNSSAATSYTFNGSASGQWNVNANWTPNTGFPVAGDTAIIPTAKSVTGLGGANQACATLTIQGTGVLTVDANTLTVSGVTTIGSSGAAGLTIASGGTFTSTSTASGAYVFGGTSSAITNNGTFNCNGGNGSGGTTPIFANNGTITFTGSQQSFNSAVAVIQGTNAILNLNSSSTTPWGGSSTLIATASSNTVSYGSAGGVNYKATTYQNLTFTGAGSIGQSWTTTTVNGNLTLGGSITANNFSGTIGGNLVVSGANPTANLAINIGGNLIIISGTLYAQSGNLAVTGTTTVSGGTLRLGNTATFTGDVSIQSGTTYNNSGNNTVTFSGNLDFSGTTFTAGTGINTFSGTNKTITGTIAIPKLTVNGTVTNAGTLTVSTTLAGSGTLIQNASSALNIGGTSSGLNLIASANTPNTVSYTSGIAQVVLGVAYDSLTLSGASAKTLGGNATVGGTLTLTAGTLSIGANSLAVSGSITRTSGSILLTVTAPTVTKAYDGATTAGTVTVGTVAGFVSGQTVTATGAGTAYSSANVGSTYANTVSYALADGTGGGLAANYSLANSAIANAAITKAPLSITAPTVTKAYNGNTTASTVTVGTISGLVGSQTVTATGMGSAYASANVGSAYANTIAYTLANGANGGLAANYSLASSVIANAAITPKGLSITAPTVTKEYDGGTTAGTVTAGTLSGFVGSETVTVSAATGTAYSSADAGSAYANTVSYTLADGSNGGLAANYSLADSVIANAAITPKALAITAPAVTKVYDGGTTAGTVTAGTLSGFVGSETVTVSAATGTAYSSADVGSAYANTVSYTLADGIGGGLAANYSLADSVIADAAITPASLTISANAESKTYGDSKTYGSGSSAYVISSGALQGSDVINTVTITDTDSGGVASATAGDTYHLTPSAAVFSTGTADNYDITYETGLLSVEKATPILTLAASDITYGQTLASSSLAGSAATNLFSLENVAGSFAFADDTIAPDAGTTNVTVNFTPTDIANYNSASSTVSMIVNSSGLTLLLTSSENPSGYKDSVFFTVTNLPVDATSNVVFEANGVPFSTNDVVNGGATSLVITDLPRGETNVIIAIYNGDNTYASMTTNLTQTVTNHPPIAGVMTVLRTAGLSLMIALSDVATNWSDADADIVTLTGVNLVTTNGVTLQTNSNWILYTNSPNVNDQISYGISDGVGGTSIGYINIVVTNSVTGTNSITSITVGNPNVITAYGIPGYSYILERATDLAPAVWVDIVTNSAATNGVISAADVFLDLGGIPPESAYYRLKWQP